MNQLLPAVSALEHSKALRASGDVPSAIRSLLGQSEALTPQQQALLARYYFDAKDIPRAHVHYELSTQEARKEAKEGARYAFTALMMSHDDMVHLRSTGTVPKYLTEETLLKFLYYHGQHELALELIPKFDGLSSGEKKGHIFRHAIASGHSGYVRSLCQEAITDGGLLHSIRCFVGQQRAVKNFEAVGKVLTLLHRLLPENPSITKELIDTVHALYAAGNDAHAASCISAILETKCSHAGTVLEARIIDARIAGRKKGVTQVEQVFYASEIRRYEQQLQEFRSSRSR